MEAMAAGDTLAAGPCSSLESEAISVGVTTTLVGATPDLPVRAPAPESMNSAASLTCLIAGARDAVGRDLSLAEVRRIVDEGPLAGGELSSGDVQDWLALLEFQYIRPHGFNTVWDEFVAQRIDGVSPLPDWCPATMHAEYYATLDAVSGEALSDAGWLWTIADASADDNDYDPDEVLIGMLEDPSVAVGIAGFMFRTGDVDAAIVRHCDISEENLQAIAFLKSHPLREVVRGGAAVDLARTLYRNC